MKKTVWRDRKEFRVSATRGPTGSSRTANSATLRKRPRTYRRQTFRSSRAWFRSRFRVLRDRDRDRDPAPPPPPAAASAPRRRRLARRLRARRVAFRLQRRAPPFPVFENAFLFSRQGFSRRRSPVRAFVRTEPSFEAFESRAKRTPFVGARVALYVVALYVERKSFLRAARRRQRPGSGEARRVRRRVRAPGAPPSRPERVDRECRALTELLSWYRNDLERVACGTRTRPGPGRRRRRRLARDARSRRERGRFLRRCAPRAHVRAAPGAHSVCDPRAGTASMPGTASQTFASPFSTSTPVPPPPRTGRPRFASAPAAPRGEKRVAARRRRNAFFSSRALGLRRRRRRARPVAVERGAEAPRFSVPVARFSSSSGVTVTRPRRLLLRVAHGAEQRRAPASAGGRGADGFGSENAHTNTGGAFSSFPSGPVGTRARDASLCVRPARGPLPARAGRGRVASEDDEEHSEEASRGADAEPARTSSSAFPQSRSPRCRVPERRMSRRRGARLFRRDASRNFSAVREATRSPSSVETPRRWLCPRTRLRGVSPRRAGARVASRIFCRTRRPFFSRGSTPTSCFLAEIFRSKSSHPVSRAKKSRSEDWSFRNPTGRRSHASHRTARAAGDVLVSEVRLTA